MALAFALPPPRETGLDLQKKKDIVPSQSNRNTWQATLGLEYVYTVISLQGKLCIVAYIKLVDKLLECCFVPGEELRRRRHV